MVKHDTTFGDMRFTEEAMQNAKRTATKEAAPIVKDLSLETKIGEMPFFKGQRLRDLRAAGLKGRQGLYEVMFMTPHLRKLILQNVGAAEIRDAAVRGRHAHAAHGRLAQDPRRGSPRWSR